MKTAVMIVNMGGPDNLDSVKQYLTNIFEDPAIISYPVGQFLRNKFAAKLANSRYEESKEIYKLLGGKTPLLEITNEQASALEKSLNKENMGTFTVIPAMRYWHPFIEDVWTEVVQQKFERVVFVSLYPFYSYTTSKSLVDLVKGLHKNGSANSSNSTNLLCVDRFGSHPLFVKAIASQINDALEQNPDYKDVLLSAHSIPMCSIKKGDPYFKEIEETVAAIRPHIKDDVNLHLAFQSKVGPVKWLGPATPDKIEELAQNGVKNLLAYPLGFVADNSETIYEIGMLYKDLAKEKGITGFVRIDSLNSHPLFIEAMKDLVLSHLKN
jgi:ferrochelatase